MKQFFINVEQMQCYNKMPKNTIGKYVMVTSAEELLEQFPHIEKLRKLTRNVREKRFKGDTNKFKKKLALDCFNLMNAQFNLKR